MDSKDIREEQFNTWWAKTVDGGQWTTLERLAAHDAWISALSTIDPEAIRRECAEKINDELAERLCENFLLRASGETVEDENGDDGEQAYIYDRPRLKAELIKNIRAAILSAGPVQDDGKAETCEWSRDDDFSDTWQGSCGVEWQMIDGTPKENHMAYCPKCGRRLEEAGE